MISSSVQPRLHTSDLALKLRERMISGAMYSGVEPWYDSRGYVLLMSGTRVAEPKSHSLLTPPEK